LPTISIKINLKILV